MKKFLSYLLIAVLCTSLFFSCATKAAPIEKDGLTAAKDYLFAMYRAKEGVTASDFQRVGILNINGVSYDVTWSANAEGITIVDQGNTVTIDVDEKTPTEINYTLTATITSADGKTITQDFSHSVPAFKELSFAEYVAAETKSAVVVKGELTGLIAKSKGNSTNGLYLQDSEGGYYVYNLAQDPVTELGLQIGQMIRVTGIKDVYSGTLEIINATVEVLEGGNAVVATDYTDKYTATDNLKDADLTYEQARLVTIKGVEIGGENEASGYYYFKLNGLESYVRISSSVCPINADEQKAFKAEHATHLGWTANVTGVLCVYDGAFYLSPVSADAFEYIGLAAKSDAEMVAFEMDNLSLTDKVTDDSTYALAQVGVGYSQVSISWASDNECAAIDGSNLVVTLPEEDAIVTVTATITSGAVSQTKSFTLAVDAKPSTLYIAKEVDAHEGMACKLALFQNNLGKTLYFNGEMSGNYLGTTDNAEKAVDVIMEDGFASFTTNGVKQYIEIYEYSAGKVGVHITDAPTNRFVFNPEVGIGVVELLGTQYYLGTYKTYDTISASAISYISGDNAKNVGISQFPLKMVEVVEAGYSIKVVSSVKNGDILKLAMLQNNLGEVLYFAGEMSGNYFATTNKVEKATDLTVEEVEGGFLLSFDADGTKKYIDINEYAAGKVGVQITETPSSVFTWAADSPFPCVNILDSQYYLGSYKTYNTISSSNISYISGDNAKNVGISQFPCMLFSIQLKEIAVQFTDTPEENTDYYLSLFQTNLDKVLYFDGTVSGRYLGTTDKRDKAEFVQVEVVDGGYRLFFSEDGVKKYVEFGINADGKTAAWVSEEPQNVYSYDPEKITFVSTVDGKSYYMGTYRTYDTISVSDISYISGDKMADIGVSQFPTTITTLSFVD